MLIVFLIDDRCRTLILVSAMFDYGVVMFIRDRKNILFLIVLC